MGASSPQVTSSTSPRTIALGEAAKYGLQIDSNGLVTWGPGSQLHPRNWPLSRKAYDTGVIIFLDFFE
jgi:hypothetical protein